MILWGCAGLTPMLPTLVMVFRECAGGLPFPFPLFIVGFGLKERTCAPSWLSWGLATPPSFGFFQDLEVGINWLFTQGYCHWLAYCSKHLALDFHQPPQTPHFYICLGFYCDPLDGYTIKPGFPLELPVTFDSIFWHSLCALSSASQCLLVCGLY